MNVILRNSTRRMIDQSRASIEAEGLIAWLRAEGYTDYVIDCHIRRLLFVLPKLSSCTAPPTLREADLVAVFGRERRPPTRFTNFASTRRVYTRYLRSQGRLIIEPQTPTEDLLRRYDQYLIDVRGLSASARCHHTQCTWGTYRLPRPPTTCASCRRWSRSRAIASPPGVGI